MHLGYVGVSEHSMKSGDTEQQDRGRPCPVHGSEQAHLRGCEGAGGVALLPKLRHRVPSGESECERLIAIHENDCSFIQGQIGQPYQGFPEPLRSDILKDLPRCLIFIKGRLTDTPAKDGGKARRDHGAPGL